MFHGRLPGTERVHQQNTPVDFARNPGQQNLPGAIAGRNPVIVLPFEYGVPELVETAGIRGQRYRPWRMSNQPEFMSSSHAPEPSSCSQETVMSSAPESNGGQEPAVNHPPQRIPHWLVRTELYLRVLLRMYIGLAICYAPWSQLFWDQNPLFVQFPTLSIYAANGAVRGVISGLGLLNIWIAVQDAIRHRNE